MEWKICTTKKCRVEILLNNAQEKKYAKDRVPRGQRSEKHWHMITRNVKYWLVKKEFIVCGIEKRILKFEVQRIMKEEISTLNSDKNHALWIDQ